MEDIQGGESMQYHKIKLNKRKDCYLGKRGRRMMRNEGYVPVNWCWKNGSSTSALIKEKEFEKFFQSTEYDHNALVDMTSDFGTARGILRVVDKNFMKLGYEHIEFHELRMDQKIVVNVPIVITGKANTSDQAAVTELVTKELEIKCLPDKIPQEITIDVSHLELNDSIHASDILLDAGVEMLTDTNATIVTCFVPVHDAPEAAPTTEVVDAVKEEVAADAAAQSAEPVAAAGGGAPAKPTKE